MPQSKPRMHDILAKWQEQLEDKLGERLDSGHEDVSPKRQLEAYRTMADEEKAELLAQWGPDKFAEWERDMEARLKQSHDKKILPWEEVLK